MLRSVQLNRSYYMLKWDYGWSKITGNGYWSCAIGVALHFMTISHEMHFQCHIFMHEDSKETYILCSQRCMTQCAYIGWPVKIAGTTCVFHDVQWKKSIGDYHLRLSVLLIMSMRLVITTHVKPCTSRRMVAQ